MKNSLEKEINISFTWNVDRSAASENEMYAKLQNLLDKFSFGYINTTCEISKEGLNTYIIKLVTDIPKYKTIVVKGEDKEILNAFDKARKDLQVAISEAKSIKHDY